ncbi:RrF2 family transcriptional regulator [Gammaproteobacteria bacterium]|nr:RrF2 family transcriptional regulator [Gammaproteobacteria bacterium]
MKLTTKSRYAINALAELLVYARNTPVRLKDISEKQNIELNYLEQIFRKLRLAGIVKSIRGRNGGYVYASDPSKISIKQVMEAVEEDLDATNCAGASSCFEGRQCSSHKLWDDLNHVVDNYLSKIFINDLVEPQNRTHILLKEINS